MYMVGFTVTKLWIIVVWRCQPCRYRRHRWVVTLCQTHGATRDDKACAKAISCLQWMTIHMMNVRWLWSFYYPYFAFIGETEWKIHQGFVEEDTASEENNAFYKFTLLEWVWINHVMPAKVMRIITFFKLRISGGSIWSIVNQLVLEISQRYPLW